MARTPKPASADDVRAWAREQGWTDDMNRPVADRGRMPTTLIADFDKAHKRNNVQYVPGYKPPAESAQGGTTKTREIAKRETTPATRQAAKASPAEKSRASAQDAPVRVASQRTDSNTPARVVNGGSAQIMESVADAIATLTAAKSANKDKSPVLGAVYFLV